APGGRSALPQPSQGWRLGPGPLRQAPEAEPGRGARGREPGGVHTEQVQRIALAAPGAGALGSGGSNASSRTPSAPATPPPATPRRARTPPPPPSRGRCPPPRPPRARAPRAVGAPPAGVRAASTRRGEQRTVGAAGRLGHISVAAAGSPR